jgi:hypothetical protein
MVKWIQRIAAAVAGVALLGVVPTVNADTLAELIRTEGSIKVGDKVFSNFSYSATGDMPTAGLVNVLPKTDLAGNFGITFQGLFTDLSSTVGGSDALIGYRVTVVDPNFLITDAHMRSNVNVVGGSTGIGTIDETFQAVQPPLPSLAGQINENFDIQLLAPGDGNQLEDHVDFFNPVGPGDGYRVIDVRKDIGLLAITGAATVSFIDQTFSQTAIVPLPPAILGGAALMSLAGGTHFLRRRRMAV